MKKHIKISEVNIMKSIVPCLWFSDGNCEEAVNYYVSIFKNSKIISIERYPDENIDEHFSGMEGKVINAEFILNGERYIALDGGPMYRFNEAISMVIQCENQEELDYYHEKLSHFKESEQCGWVKDKFGLSWQIIPSNMGELIKTEAQIKAMMRMKKIVIQELLDAK